MKRLALLTVQYSFAWFSETASLCETAGATHTVVSHRFVKRLVLLILYSSFASLCETAGATVICLYPILPAGCNDHNTL